ncbi:MAG: PcfB family protein [Ruminococcus sp.]
MTNIEITDKNIKSFDRVARKYSIDYSLKKDSSTDPPRYLVFFKAKDVDVMTKAFQEYAGISMKKRRRRCLSGRSCRSPRSERQSSVRSEDKDETERQGAVPMIKKTKPGHSGKKIKGKAPPEKAGSSAWGQKLSAMLREKLQTVNLKKVIAMNIPYIIFFYVGGEGGMAVPALVSVTAR